MFKDLPFIEAGLRKWALHHGITQVFQEKETCEISEEQGKLKVILEILLFAMPEIQNQDFQVEKNEGAIREWE